MPIFLQPYKKYATFSGRASRSEYWLFYLFFFVATIVTSVIDVFAGKIAGTFQFFTGMFCFFTLLPFYAVTVRRLHDTDRSGWWFAGLIAACIALAGSGIYLALQAIAGDGGGSAVLGSFALFGVVGILNVGFTVFLCLPSTPGVNTYGEQPQA